MKFPKGPRFTAWDRKKGWIRRVEKRGGTPMYGGEGIKKKKRDLGSHQFSKKRNLRQHRPKGIKTIPPLDFNEEREPYGGGSTLIVSTLGKESFQRELILFTVHRKKRN